MRRNFLARGLALGVLAAASAHSETTILALDFSSGAPTDARVSVRGGAWKKGWLVTGGTDRILIDMGREIRNGYVEVAVSRSGPLTFEQRKRNWMGVFAEARGHQSPGGYARAGGEPYKFSKAEIFAASQTNTICEKTFGELGDWVLDGKTERVVRAEIRGNVMTWSTDKGGSASCGSDSQPVTHFRFVMLGGLLEEINGWHHGSLIGLKVLRVRIVDLGQ